METSHTALFFMLLLIIATLVKPLAKKFHMPFGTLLVVIGFIVSELSIKKLGIDTGIRWYNLDDVVFYVLLPVLIFHSAITIDIKLLLRNIVPIALLSLPLMLISLTVTATCIFYGINHPSGFPWIAALITGALLTAIEPGAILPLLEKNKVSKRLGILLEGEGLFNDVTSVVIFTMLVAIATGLQTTENLNLVFVYFIRDLLGGTITGIAIGFCTYLVIRIMSDRLLIPLIIVLCPYITFLVAGELLSFSGIVAVLSAGLTVSFFNRKTLSEVDSHLNHQFITIIAHVAEAMIFLLAGITILLSMFTERWLAIAIGIVAIILARAVMIFGTFPLLKLLPVEPVTVKQQSVLVWGGVRGTVALALALSLPASLDYWYTIQSITYGVVLFTLFVQATTISPLLRKLNLPCHNDTTP